MFIEYILLLLLYTIITIIIIIIVFTVYNIYYYTTVYSYFNDHKPRIIFIFFQIVYL